MCVGRCNKCHKSIAVCDCNKPDSPLLPADTIVSGQNIFDYADHFYKWNNKHDHNFHSFVLWCIYTKQGQKFMKEAIRNQSA